MIRYVCDRCGAEDADPENEGNAADAWFTVDIEHQGEVSRVLFCSGKCASQGLEAIAANLATHDCGAAHADETPDEEPVAATRPPKGN